MSTERAPCTGFQLTSAAPPLQGWHPSTDAEDGPREYGRDTTVFPDAPVVAAIEDNPSEPEFAFESRYNSLSVDISSTGSITITVVVREPGLNAPVNILLHSAAFQGYDISQVNSNLPTSMDVVFLDTSMTFSIPDTRFAQAGSYEAAFQLHVSFTRGGAGGVCTFQPQGEGGHGTPQKGRGGVTWHVPTNSGGSARGMIAPLQLQQELQGQ